MCFALDPISLVRDNRAKETLSAEGVSVCSFNADLLYEPWEVVDDESRPFSTFSDFWEKCLTMPYDPEAPLLPPKRIISGLFSSIVIVLNAHSPFCSTDVAKNQIEPAAIFSIFV